MNKQKRIRVYLMEVNDLGVPCKGYFTEIDDTLKELQEIVGGHIEVIHLTDEILIIINEDGKFDDNCLPSRVLVGEDGTVLDVIYGNILVCRCTGEDFSDIFEEDKEIILRSFKAIRLVGGTLISISEENLIEVENKRR